MNRWTSRIIAGVFAFTAAVAVASWVDYAQKIHGKDASGNKIRCRSYENEISSDRQYDLIEHALLSAAAYQDSDVAYGDVKRIDAYKETKYVPLSQSEVEKCIQGSGLHVRASGGEIVVTGDNPNALNAVLFTDPATGAIVISYRGSKELQDWIDDGIQVTKLGVPEQYKDSSALLAAVLRNTDRNVICDGHSLGGGEVTYAMADNDIMARDANGNVKLDNNGNPVSRVTGNTFNAAGLSDATLKDIEKRAGSDENIRNAAANIMNVRNEFDPVSYVGYHLGDTYEVTWASSAENAHTVQGDHGIRSLVENMISAGGYDNVWNIIQSPAPIQQSPAPPQGSQGGSQKSGTTTLGSMVLDKVNALIDNALSDLCKKHPVLQEIFSALKISGSSITGAAINVGGVLKDVLFGSKTLKDAIKDLSCLAIEGLKNMAASLVEWGLDKLQALLNNVINKALDWILNKLNDWTNSINNKFLRMALGQAQRALAKWKSKGVTTMTGKLRKKAVQSIKNKANGGSPGKTTGGTVFQDVINRVDVPR